MKRPDETIILTKSPTTGAWEGSQQMGTPGSGGPMGSIPVDVRPGGVFHTFTYSQLERAANLHTPPATELVVNLTKKQILAVTA